MRRIAVYLSLFSIISTPFQSAAQESSTAMSTSKVHIWWHWADGNITREGITKDLEAMKATGISQATIINVGYFFKDKDFGVPKVKFNSPEWHAMFSWALIEAKRLHMTIGAHQCDGWSSSGGPWITPELSMKTTTWSKSIVNGGSNVTLTLPTPFHRRNYYRDVAVFAYRTPITASNFTLQQPRFVLND